MERVLEIFPDGSIYEMEGKVAVKAIATTGQVKLLSKAVRFTLAKTFAIAPPDRVHPQVREIGVRGGMTINQDEVNLIKYFEVMKLEAYLDTVCWGLDNCIRIYPRRIGGNDNYGSTGGRIAEKRFSII